MPLTDNKHRFPDSLINDVSRGRKNLHMYKQQFIKEQILVNTTQFKKITIH